MNRDGLRARVAGARRLPELSATHRGLLALTVAGCLWLGIASLPVQAQTPTPSAAAATALPGGDTRSEGEGAGLVGQPVLIAAAVMILGAAAAGVTVLYVRISRED